MLFIGKMNYSCFKDIIVPAYMNYERIGYDLFSAKKAIIEFVLENYFDAFYTLPIDPNCYTLNICDPKRMKLSSREIDDMMFIISVKSGKVYVY